MTESSHIINRAALDASVTTFQTVFEELFTSRANDALVSAFCEDMSSGGGSIVQLTLDDYIGAWREFLGARIINASRAYTLNIPIATYEQTLVIPRRDVEYDLIGQTARRIRKYLASAKSFRDQIMHDQLLFLNNGAGPLGYDGVALFSAAHPFGPAGNQSNLGTAALSQLSFNTAFAQMASLARENNEPFGVMPYMLVCGPALRSLALEITRADVRGRSVANTGAEAAAAVVASAGVTNINAGVVEPMIDTRLFGARAAWWYLIGTTDSGAKPVIYIEGRPPTQQLDVAIDSPTVMESDAYTYGLITDGRYAPGAWQTAFWSNGTT